MNVVCIAIGGSVGAVARYLVAASINVLTARAPYPLPFGTLFVNVTGSFAIGFLFALFSRVTPPNEVKLFLITGFLGAYTTFSSYSLETVNLALDGKYWLAASNFLLNNILCLALCLAGMAVARSVFGK